ncbi:hypothetical protein F5148DRAFT_1281828 [Russula earlei]|uniref:Uncharacterized protein n=1 Tax=Russula earlei TaxID=71964 RepID=A0ACC0UG87_9AGAM|nr:hypothetical protein F5148DRAFT_1281828 [Russula earlei]
MADQLQYQCINPNPDISGIGIRINFYVTILLAGIVPDTRHTTELLDGLYKSSVLYGFALVMTAVIQTLQGQLDLYHAVVVTQIVFSLNLFYIYALKRFFISSGRDYRMRIFIKVQVFSTLTFTIWSLFVWIKDSDFGSQPECNYLVKYVFFFVTVRATVGWLRILLIVSLSSVIFQFFLLAAIYKIWYAFADAEQEGQYRGTEQEGRHRGTEQGDAHGPGAFGTVFTYIVTFISATSAVFGVAFVELIVQRNSPIILPGENAWGFGQIIALILIFGSIIDILVAIRQRNE